MYVDLNPIRAGMEKDLVDSDFTSIQQRLFDYAKRKPVKNQAEKTVVKRINDQRKLKADMKMDKLPEAPLMPIDGSSHTDVHAALPFTRADYFELVDATGRIMRDDKKGFIPSKVPPILLRFGIQPHKWLDHVRNFSRRYGYCAGSVARMQGYATAVDKRWCKGVGVSQRLAS